VIIVVALSAFEIIMFVDHTELNKLQSTTQQQMPLQAINTSPNATTKSRNARINRRIDSLKLLNRSYSNKGQLYSLASINHRCRLQG
jgi:hypothetical protein